MSAAISFLLSLGIYMVSKNRTHTINMTQLHQFTMFNHYLFLVDKLFQFSIDYVKSF